MEGGKDKMQRKMKLNKSRDRKEEDAAVVRTEQAAMHARQEGKCHDVYAEHNLLLELQSIYVPLTAGCSDVWRRAGL